MQEPNGNETGIEIGTNPTEIVETDSNALKPIEATEIGVAAEPGRITIIHKAEKLKPKPVEKKRRLVPPASDYKPTGPAFIKKEIEEIHLEINPLKEKNAPDILFKYSFQINCLPRGLRLEEDVTDSSKYMEQRTKEIKESGLPEKRIEESRLGIVDTGLPMGEFKFCQAGIDVFYQLLKAGYKIVDAYRKIETKVHGSKLSKPKYVAYLLLSQNGERMILRKDTFEDFKEIMKKTMTAYAWDNRRLPQNNVVVNFPYEHLDLSDLSKKIPYTQKFVIKN